MSTATSAQVPQRFLQYDEPSTANLLVLISFFACSWLAQYIAAKLIKASIIGPIVVGIVYGTPLAEILRHDWQETFLSLGYIGLILLIFEGGLSARLDLLRANIRLSTCAAATGIVFPIALSYLLLYLVFGYGAVETFIIGAALSSTSLGTTFAVMSGASKIIDLSQTRVGAVLVSAALLDDVSGLVMSSVIHNLGDAASGSTVNLGWLIGRPILASVGLAALTPLLAKFVAAPLFRKYLERRLAKHKQLLNIVLLVGVLCAFVAAAGYAGTSVLLGAFLAGSFLTCLPSRTTCPVRGGSGTSEREQMQEIGPTFADTYENLFIDVQHYMLEPLFFASIGFAIPFLDLWNGVVVWQGLVFTLLMLLAKIVVGLWIPLWALVQRSDSTAVGEERHNDDGLPLEDTVQPGPPVGNQNTRLLALRAAVSPGVMLGLAMVARGEIGLLIIQIGYNETEYLSQAGFLVAIWGILLNTIIGPIAVGVLVKHRAEHIGRGEWGVVSLPEQNRNEGGA